MSDTEQPISGQNQPDEDLTLPKATLSKLIQELLPSPMTITKDCKDLFGDLCIEFIHLVSSEANEVCDSSNKKTISGEHVLQALKNLGFEEYLEECETVFKDFNVTVKKEREKKKDRKDTGMTEEEMIKFQEDMFRKARERLESGIDNSAQSTE